MYEAISIEDRNKPTVVLCNEGFATDARSAASGKGRPGMRIVPESVPCGCGSTADAEEGVSAVMRDVIAALTKPLTDEERSPAPKEAARTPSRIVFRGSLDDVSRFFYRRGWTDGLPIVPPTERAVAEMLTGTDLPPDHVVGKIIPRLGKATVEKIAINAVMAGALPTYMPVLLAALEIILNPMADFGTWEVSTGSFAPLWILNGPIRTALGINCGAGPLNPGNMANASIGRALGLIVKNIGGARPGLEDMSQFGNPGRYTWVLGENEEETPWEPLHVERGFDKDDSTITAFFPNTSLDTLAYQTSASGILSAIVYNSPGGTVCYLLNPEHAKILANEGWGKEQVRAFISEHTTEPFYRNALAWGEHWGLYGGEAAPKRLVPQVPLSPHDPIRLLPDPSRIITVVTGGLGGHIMCLKGSTGFKSDAFFSAKIRLPSNWDELVQRYKGMTPSYTLY